MQWCCNTKTSTSVGNKSLCELLTVKNYKQGVSTLPASDNPLLSTRADEELNTTLNTKEGKSIENVSCASSIRSTQSCELSSNLPMSTPHQKYHNNQQYQNK